MGVGLTPQGVSKNFKEYLKKMWTNYKNIRKNNKQIINFTKKHKYLIIYLWKIKKKYIVFLMGVFQMYRRRKKSNTQDDKEILHTHT